MFASARAAIAAAVAIQRGLAALKPAPPDGALRVRVGVDAREVRTDGADVGGEAVDTAAHIAAAASPGEIFISRVVRDLVGTMAVECEDRGEHELEGFPVPGPLFAVRWADPVERSSASFSAAGLTRPGMSFRILGPLERALADAPATLLHGDVKLENLGLWPDGRFVAIDWGELTGVGPREIDVAWYALKGAARIGCSPAAIFADYEAAASEPLDSGVLDVVCIGSLAQMGFRFALGAYDTGPEPTVIAGQLLAWWVERARAALARTGSI